jgi:hypothetical protein
MKIGMVDYQDWHGSGAEPDPWRGGDLEVHFNHETNQLEFFLVKTGRGKKSNFYLSLDLEQTETLLNYLREELEVL